MDNKPQTNESNFGDIRTPDIPEITLNELAQITEGDFTEAITMLKNRKATGRDGIAKELTKCGGKQQIEELTILYNKIIRLATKSEEYRTTLLIPLFKKC